MPTHKKKPEQRITHAGKRFVFIPREGLIRKAKPGVGVRLYGVDEVVKQLGGTHAYWTGLIRSNKLPVWTFLGRDYVRKNDLLTFVRKTFTGLAYETAVNTKPASSTTVDPLPQIAPAIPPISRTSFTGFDRERRAFESHKVELLKDEGHFVLIKGDDVVGVWSTYEETLEAGYGRFGLQPFYVKQIAAVEPVLQFTRDVVPCQT